MKLASGIAIAVLLALAAGCEALSDRAPNEGPPRPAVGAGPAGAGGRDAPAGATATAEIQRAAVTLEHAVRAALSNRRDVAIAERRVLIARDQVDAARAGLLPSAGATGRFQARSNDPGVSFNGVDLVTGQRETAFAQVGVVVPIYDLVAWNLVDATKMGVDATRHDAVRARQDLELAVTLSYFRVLEADKIEEVARESLRAIEEQVATSRAYFQQGLVARADVLAAEVRQGERRQELVRARSNIEIAIATLNRLAGLDVRSPRDLAEVFDPMPVEPREEALEARALEARPDLRSLDALVELRRAEVRAARAGLAPRLFAFGDYNWQSDKNLLNNDWASGGVAVEVPLFGRGVLNEVEIRRNELAQAVDRRAEASEDVRLEVRRAWLEAIDARDRLPIADDAVILADENLRAVRERYAQGIATSAEVLIEEQERATARARRLRALYDLHAAVARLKNAVGQE